MWNERKGLSVVYEISFSRLNEGGKEWAGLVYIGGTHPAAEGGAYMVAIKGFAGIYFEDGKIKAKPDLPKAWKK